MIDFHSHILPCVDDGSRSVEESISMLKLLMQQGIDTVVATPHFSANHEKSVDSFIKRRDDALEELNPFLNTNPINIRCGAEVSYYSGISRMKELKKLCISGSNLLLLEMPMSRWTEYTINEIIELANCGTIIIVLAHIERYISLQKRDIWQRLYENGILMQVNASFFLKFTTKRKAVSMIKNGEIHLIGSDCHNMTSRPPKIGDAYKLISYKLGKNFSSRVNEFGNMLLNG